MSGATAFRVRFRALVAGSLAAAVAAFAVLAPFGNPGEVEPEDEEDG